MVVRAEGGPRPRKVQSARISVEKFCPGAADGARDAKEGGEQVQFCVGFAGKTEDPPLRRNLRARVKGGFKGSEKSRVAEMTEFALNWECLETGGGLIPEDLADGALRGRHQHTTPIRGVNK